MNESITEKKFSTILYLDFVLDIPNNTDIITIVGIKNNSPNKLKLYILTTNSKRIVNFKLSLIMSRK